MTGSITPINKSLSPEILASDFYDASEGAWWGPKKGNLMKLLLGKTPDEISKIDDSYRAKHGHGLRTAAREVLEAEDLTFVEDLIDGRYATNPNALETKARIEKTPANWQFLGNIINDQKDSLNYYRQSAGTDSWWDFFNDPTTIDNLRQATAIRLESLWNEAAQEFNAGNYEAAKKIAREALHLSQGASKKTSDHAQTNINHLSTFATYQETVRDIVAGTAAATAAAGTAAIFIAGAPVVAVVGFAVAAGTITSAAIHGSFEVVESIWGEGKPNWSDIGNSISYGAKNGLVSSTIGILLPGSAAAMAGGRTFTEALKKFTTNRLKDIARGGLQTGGSALLDGENPLAPGLHGALMNTLLSPILKTGGNLGARVFKGVNIPIVPVPPTLTNVSLLQPLKQVTDRVAKGVVRHEASYYLEEGLSELGEIAHEKFYAFEK